jgi:transposase
MVATKPVDFRKGAEGLAALVREEMGADPFSGAVYVFRAKRADRIKLIFWDGSGVCLYAKRLEDGAFRWPNVADGVMRLTAAELVGAARRARLAAHPCGPPDPRPACGGLTCDRLNQPRLRCRGRAANLFSSSHGDDGC